MNGADLWDRHIESYGLGVTMTKDETIRLQAEEIGRLRGLLREIGDIGWLQAPHPLTKRVREAIGE